MGRFRPRFPRTERGPLTSTSPVDAYLGALHERVADLRGGEVASYIPELAKADPSWFGICIATADGHVYEVGDTRQRFSIQSISKPLTYGIALGDHGQEAVAKRIGVEPSGDAFNEISLAPDTGTPLNPMINAGAIAASSLIAGATPDARLERLLAVYSAYAGRKLDLDLPIYTSELDSGHRNRAIGHMLRSFDVLTSHPEATLDLYFRQCSVSVDCRDLALMAATLANGGSNPLTGERAVAAELVQKVLSVMTTCGMYDFAGEWADRVGLPAKSGVGGGIMSVLPGQLGIAVFSPPLDAQGNSVRGIEVCKALSEDLELHFLRVARSSRSAIRASYTLETVRSKRRRSEHQQAMLLSVGNAAVVFELSGDLLFPSGEAVVRAVVERSEPTELVLLDLTRVSLVSAPAAQLLAGLVDALRYRGAQLVVIDPSDRSQVGDGQAASRRPAEFSDLDAAIEWAEGQLLQTRTGPEQASGTIALADHPICAGLEPEALRRLEQVLTSRRFQPGEHLVTQGDVADGVYLLLGGDASVIIALPDGRKRRAATLSAGTSFGEVAAVSPAPRTATVRADKAGECRVLSPEGLDRLGEIDAETKSAVLANMLIGAFETVSRLDREVAALSSRDQLT
ncbi:MAG: glutaminase A [Thermoleophilaceae bacterium]|nr:glutaminase A [Thermoleophilaceae bacterium]